MALFDLMTQKKAGKIPFERDFKLFRSRLTIEERASIDEWIDARIEGDEIHTAGWMPGHDWRGTVLDPIYTKAARGHYDLAARAFGLFVYVRFMEHPDAWVSGRFEMNGQEIGSRTYFRRRD